MQGNACLLPLQYDIGAGSVYHIHIPQQRRSQLPHLGRDSITALSARFSPRCTAQL